MHAILPSAAGLEVMIDAREIAPPWAAFSNTSGPSWSEFPGPDHYDDYVRYLGVMLDRYAPYATAVRIQWRVAA